MATLRCHTRIQQPADAVWAVISSPERICEWFPGMVDATVVEGVRTITLATGMPLIEDVVTVDHRLRRFQYRVTGPMPMRFHLATMDVIDDDPVGSGSSCLLVYSTEIEPDPLAFVFDGAIAAAVANLACLLDAGELGPEPTGSACPTDPPAHAEPAAADPDDQD